MNLDTTYLNLKLHSPLVVSASPLSQSIDNIKRMEDCRVGAIVLYSLFEEQLRLEQQVANYLNDHPKATPADVQALFPAQKQFHAGLEAYLNHIRRCKESVTIPITASTFAFTKRAMRIISKTWRAKMAPGSMASA